MVLSRLMRATGAARSISQSKAAHGALITSGALPDLIASNHLISMYSKCGLMDHAHNVFDQMPQRNTVSWTTLISGYSKIGPAEAAIGCFRLMLAANFTPNDFTYVSVISACAGIGAVNTGKEIHCRIYRVEENVSSIFVSNSLINLYAKCGMMVAAERVFGGMMHPNTVSAERVFGGMMHPNTVSWSSLLSGYCQHGEGREALRVFSRAQKVGVEVNEFLLAGVVKACAGIGNLATGKVIHCYVLKSGSGSDVFVETGIIDMYIACGDVECAERMFLEIDDPGLASWAVLAGGYAQHGQGEKAMSLFKKLHSSGTIPNEHIFPTILAACSVAGSNSGGKLLHSLIIKLGVRMSSYTGNAVVDFYAKRGLLEDCSHAFEEMDSRDVVAWNAVISGHIENSDLVRAAELLQRMLREGIAPNTYTYSIALNLCADLPALGWGQETHTRMVKPGFDNNVVVGSGLVDMYAKCGRLKDAHKVFDRLSLKNLVSWNIMLGGYAQHGFGREALEMFTMMQREGIGPNDVTFIGVLSACAHVGLVEEGKHYFDLMTKYRIVPRIDHYACMVDLLARAGQTQVAYELVENMPLQPNEVIWRSLLAGCKKHGDLLVGKRVAERILEMDSEDVNARVMLSGSYANADMWEEVVEVRRLPRGFKKIPGWSWIRIKDRNHCFLAGDGEAGIHDLLNGLVVQLIEGKYRPEADNL